MKLRGYYPLLAALLLISSILILPKQVRAEGISIDAERGTVNVNAFINYRYIRKPNQLAVVHREGYNAKRALFISEACPAEFYDALVGLGVQPGENLYPDSPAGIKTEGDRLRVYVTWEGLERRYRLSDIVVDDEGKGFEVRFSGNRENMVEVPTGYLLTLESSYLSVTGNARLGLTPYGQDDRQFKVKREILPENGTPVTIIFQLVK